MMLGALGAHIQKIDLHAGRRTVAVGVLVGAAAFIYLVANQDADLYSAFMKALAAVALTMVVVAVAGNFFSRDQKIKGAQAHAGPDGVDVGVTFEDKIATAVEQVSDGMKEQMGIVDRRLGRLEEAMFKEKTTDCDREE